MEKMVRRINTLSRRWFWWYFQKDRNSISICNLDGKMKKNAMENGENLSFPNVDFPLIFLKEFPLQNQVKLTFSRMDFLFILRSSFHMDFKIRSFRKYHQNHRADKVLNINCVSELVNHPAVSLFVFRAQDEFNAIDGSVAKFRALRVQRIQPELQTRLEREIPAWNALKGDFFKTHFHCFSFP